MYSFHTLETLSHDILCVCSTSLLKTLWEKEKLLVMREFSAIVIKSKIVFCKLFQFGSI